MQAKLQYMQIRGGSSKGLYFDGRQFPSDEQARNQILLNLMGKGERQIDGLGGGHPLTSKAALIWPSSRQDADVDYLFVQIIVGKDLTDTTPNCGNILAGVGPFAIESGMLDAAEGETKIRVYLVNSDKLCELVVQTPNRQVTYEGNAEIAGVPGKAAPILCNYKNIAGSACGSLLPTGSKIDQVDGIDATCIDNGMPVVVLRAIDLGISGYESPDELNKNESLKSRLQSIRLQLGPKMNLGNVDGAAVPKMCIISAPRAGGVVNTRTFIPYECHEAIGVLGAVSVATACVLQGTVAAGIVNKIESNDSGALTVSIEHPSGEFTSVLETSGYTEGLEVKGAGLLRTARLLSRGEVYIPNSGE